MRLTTMLDALAEAGSGPWPPVASTSAPARTAGTRDRRDSPVAPASRDLTDAPASRDLTHAPASRNRFDVPVGSGTLALGTETEFEQLVSTLIPCRANDAELWFAERTDEVERAKALCRACPVREGCLAGALERQEPWGVWGGEVFVDGVVVARKRGRGRPRKGENL